MELSQIGAIFGAVILFTLCGCFVWLYVKNFMKAVTAVRKSELSIRTFLRVVGVFFPLFGIVMGFIK